MSDMDKKQALDFREIRKSIKFESDTYGTYVVAIAESNDFEDNITLEIPSNYGRSMSPEVHNSLRGVYYINGVEYHQIGLIPFSCKITMDNTEWCVNVPMPESVIMRHLTVKQKKLFEEWKSQNNGCQIRFLQLNGNYPME